jgi:hypothetical protein
MAFIIDNDLEEGTFAEWLRYTPYYKKATAPEVTQFWRDQGFTEESIASEWRFERREDLEKVVRLEFGDELATRLLAKHDGVRISCHYKLYYRGY